MLRQQRTLPGYRCPGGSRGGNTRFLRLAAVLAASLTVSACAANQDSGQTAEGDSAALPEMTQTVSTKETMAKALYEFAESGIAVTLTADRETYDEGDEIRYTLTIENSARNRTIARNQMAIRLGDGLAASEEETERVIPQLKTGESAVLTGILHADGAAKPAQVGKASTVETGASLLEVRPYLQLPVDGEQRTVRFVLDLPVVQVVQQVDSAHRRTPKNVSVHDPSVFRDTDGTWYLVGTHITSARSDDLFDWEQTDEVFREALSEETRDKIRSYNDDEGAGNWNDYLWAPDMIYNEQMQKYCIYLSANGDHWQSNIVLLTGDSVEGPFTYAGTVVYGGFTEENWRETDVADVLGVDELPDRYIQYGVKNSRWGDLFPNCIDPCVFYDEEGALWMSYGSWSGGIFLLRLDEETGLRDHGAEYPTGLHSDAYFGKLIAGGCYVSGEGSYIQHIGNFYWLFISYGNLEAKGGYNIRVFRSGKPDGPYVDALGNTPFYDEYRFNYNESVGVRLFGGYQWRTSGEGMVAQGHNSAAADADGRAYIVYHTRTTNGSEGHYVQVHQLFLNKDGWLVAAPYRTSGEILPEKGLPDAEIAGDYEIILHRLDLDYAAYEVNRPQNITLEADGTVTGEYTGRWEAEAGTPYFTIVLRASSDGGSGEEVTYRGVALTMAVDGTDIETTVFTALGEENQLTLWGSRELEE